MNLLATSTITLGLAAATASAGISTLSASMTVDNIFTASISSDPTTLGTAFLSGTSWPTTYTADFSLDAPGTYYLHIRAEDLGRPAMFIGAFSLTGDSTFANGTNQLITDASGNWTAATSTLDGTPANIIELGPNGTSPWGNFPAMGDAKFIWAEGSPSPLVTYFTTTITVVPTPAGLSALAIPCLAMSARRRRRG